MKKIKLHKNKLIVAVSIVIVMILGIISYLFSVNKTVEAWENKIYPGVNVYGIDIGGLTKEEATSVLEKNLLGEIVDKKIKVIVADKTLELGYETLDITYDVESIVSEAMKYGKDKTLFDKKSLIKSNDSIDLHVEITYDEEALLAFEDKVLEAVNVKAQNATITVNSGNISIIPEVSGKTIDREALHNQLIENINTDSNEVVELTFELQEQEAEVKAADLEQITGKISEYSSNYVNTGDGRVRNMEIAAETVSGTVIMPGEEFSYNALIGDTTPDKGYEIANTYVGNKIVPDYGGGICQVSTTLYRAVMRANIRSTERSNHSLMVSYSQAGLDATVANGVIDYKFVNTYDFPIYIDGYVSGGVVNFSIYGNVEAMGNYTYELVSETIETYQPKKTYEEDSTMYEGTEKVVSYGMTGYKAKAYQVTYENGVEVNRELISTDVYYTTDTVIKKGTKKKETTTEKEDSNNNTENEEGNSGDTSNNEEDNDNSNSES